MMCKRISLRSLFCLLRQLRTVMWGAAVGKYRLVSELHNVHIVRQVFFRLQFSAAESWMAV